MSKTIVSAFDSQQTATRLLASAIASGFDSRFFSVINSTETEKTPLDSLGRMVPSIQARLYRKHLQKGDSLLVAQVPENEVARLIKLLQSTGGHHIEAFDQVNVS
jgi:flagellar motor switch protein FliG